MNTIKTMLAVTALIIMSCYVSAAALGQNCADGIGCQSGGCAAGGCSTGCGKKGCRGGCKSGCGQQVQCPSCQKYCKFEMETVKEKKSGWDVECKAICIPKITLPWQKCCTPKCAKMKYVRVLKKEEYECEHCQCKFTPVCDEDCKVPFSRGCAHGCGRAGCTGCSSGVGCSTGLGCAVGAATNAAPSQPMLQPISPSDKAGLVIPPPPIVVEDVQSRN